MSEIMELCVKYKVYKKRKQGYEKKACCFTENDATPPH